MARGVAAFMVLSLGCGHHAAHTNRDSGVDTASPDASGDAPSALIVELNAISPPLAMQSGTVVLEGSFSGPAVAQLPGGTTAALTVLGPHRATITIPAGTERGGASVPDGSATPPRVMFHGVSYTPGLRRAESYEQGDGARQPGVLDQPRDGQGSIVLDDHIYLIGGGTNAALMEISAAAINADGSLSAFAPAPGISLVHPRTGLLTLAAAKYVYAIGGTGPDDSMTFSTEASIERAPINADHTLGTFEVLPTTLVVPRYAAMGVVIGNFIYVIGGYTPNVMMPVDAVERAVINPDGTLGNFERVMGVALVQARSDAAAVVIHDQLYVVGGYSGAVLGSVEAARIAPDGTISTFATLSNVSLLVPRFGLSAVVLNDSLYVLAGGGDYSNPSTEIERAPIQGDGTLGAFVATGVDLGSSWRLYSTVAVTTNYAYVIAGMDGTLVPGNLPTLRLPIDIGDSLDKSRGLPSVTLDTAVYDHATVAVGSYVYAIGGTSGSGFSGAVQRATVTDGDLGTFATLPGVTLATPRAGFASAVIGNYVYLIGGATSGGAVGTLERASIAPDGTLGTFTTYTASSLVTPRAHTAAVIVRAYAATELYVLGGIGADGTILGTLEEAPINADGSLGAFTVKTGYGLTTPRYDHRLVAIDYGVVDQMFVFAVGGIGASGYLGDVERGNIQADGTLGPFVALAGATLTPRAGHTATVIGDRVYVLGGSSATGPLDSIESATISVGQYGVISLSAFASTNGVSLATPRGHLTGMVIANQMYSIGGLGSSAALPSIELAPLN